MVVKKYSNGDRYEGEWEDDMKNGKGTLSYADGGKYEGEWVDNMRNGYGVNIWKNGDRYKGNWENNKKHGKGKLVYANGGEYNGNWENDMRNGHGVNTWTNGNTYDGSWADNAQHGQGTFTYADAGSYVGEWAENLRDGYGVNTWPTGARYEGSWRNNRKHGQGTLYHVDGSKEVGVWANDRLDGQPPATRKKNNTTRGNGKNTVEFKGMWINGQPFLVLLMPKSSVCPYLELAKEFIISLDWGKAYFDHSNNRCYCTECYKESWKDVIEAGDGKYVIPRGWVRVGLQVDTAKATGEEIWDKWIVTFHGTTKIAAQSIIKHRQFCHPGDVLIDGTKLSIRPGHIPGQMYVFTSPTIAYSSGLAYSPVYDFHSNENDSDYETQIVLQCRQMPKSFKIGPETIGAGNVPLCPHIPNSEIEYFTDRRGTIIAYGILVRFRPKNN